MESKRFWRRRVHPSAVQQDMEARHCAVQQVSVKKQIKNLAQHPH